MNFKYIRRDCLVDWEKCTFLLDVDGDVQWVSPEFQYWALSETHV